MVSLVLLHLGELASQLVDPLADDALVDGRDLLEIGAHHLNKSLDIETWILGGLLQDRNDVRQDNFINHAEIGPRNMATNELDQAALDHFVLLLQVGHFYYICVLVLEVSFGGIGKQQAPPN